MDQAVESTDNMYYNTGMNKDYFRKNLSKYEREITMLYYNQLMNKTNRQTMISRAKQLLIAKAKHLGLKQDEVNELWRNSYNSYLTLQKQLAYKRDVNDKSKIFWENLPDIQVTRILNMIEARKKDKQISAMMLSETPFYLCSSHPNPAKDHKDYQGQIYINTNWRSKVKDNATRSKIKAYIYNHHIRTVEWVIGPPVYMITRPNCKHFFIPIPVEDVLHSSAKRLIQKYNAIGEDESRTFNVENYNKKQKFKLLRFLNRIRATDFLRKQIKKNRARFN